MHFLLNTRFYWKNVRQGDEKPGKTAQKLGNRPVWQQTRASAGWGGVHNSR
jgi:hypothetical protein